MDYESRLRELGSRPAGQGTPADIAAIESDIGVALPEPYRMFLNCCGGWWGDILCPAREPTPFGEHNLSGFHDAAEVRGYLDSNITPRNMVTIGTGHFAKYTCLSVAGIDRGAVYSLDGEFRCFWTDEEFELRFNAMDDEIRRYLELRRTERLSEKPAGYDSLYLLADTFDEFLRLCHPVSED